jgi:hypothetical protein
MQAAYLVVLVLSFAGIALASLYFLRKLYAGQS